MYEGTFKSAAKIVGDETYSLITDYLGTPVEMYDSNGNKTWEVEYDIYGKVRKLVTGSLSSCPFRYQGQYEDAETGLYYNRFRYYSADEGVYLSQDPIRLSGNNPNIYSYVSDTNVWMDVDGLSGLPKVFWSGGPRAQEAARAHAKKIGGEILEMTPQGEALENWTKGMDWKEAEPLWKKTSEHFAGSVPSTQKHAIAFIDSSRYRGSGSVWESIERKILNNKGVTHEVIDVNKVKCH